MRKYEIMYIIAPNLDEAATKEVLNVLTMFLQRMVLKSKR